MSLLFYCKFMKFDSKVFGKEDNEKPFIFIETD